MNDKVDTMLVIGIWSIIGAMILLCALAAFKGQVLIPGAAVTALVIAFIWGEVLKRRQREEWR